LLRTPYYLNRQHRLESLQLFKQNSEKMQGERHVGSDGTIKVLRVIFRSV